MTLNVLTVCFMKTPAVAVDRCNIYHTKSALRWIEAIRVLREFMMADAVFCCLEVRYAGCLSAGGSTEVCFQLKAGEASLPLHPEGNEYLIT